MKGVFTTLRMNTARTSSGIKAVEECVLLKFDVCDKPVA
jgi:hypothetical protein